MSFGMTSKHVSDQMRSVQSQVARSRSRSPQQSQAVGRRRHNLPALRTRVGFTLVEAGLRLMAPASSHQHN